MSDQRTPIQRALDLGFDGKRYRMAKALGIDPANVYKWLNGAKVDPRFCVAIEIRSGRAVTRDELRPDVFPATGEAYPIHPASKDGLYPDAGSN